MNILKKLRYRLMFWGLKRKMITRISQLNRPVLPKKESKKKIVLQKKPNVKNLNLVREYLGKYSKNIHGLFPGWSIYIQEMIDELIDNGLTLDDEIHMKEKYATIRCGIIAKDKKNQDTFNRIIDVYSKQIDSKCQFCCEDGIGVSIDGWDYNLCLQHFLETKYEIVIDDEIHSYEKYFNHKNYYEEEERYRNNAITDYNKAEMEYFNIIGFTMIHYLKNKFNLDQELTKAIMSELFETIIKDFWGYGNEKEATHLEVKRIYTVNGKILNPPNNKVDNSDYFNVSDFVDKYFSSIIKN